jgi:hypothetical protein
MTVIPVQVTFRGLAQSDALEADIRARVDWLEQFYAGIVRVSRPGRGPASPSSRRPPFLHPHRRHRSWRRSDRREP